GSAGPLIQYRARAPYRGGSRRLGLRGANRAATGRLNKFSDRKIVARFFRPLPAIRSSEDDPRSLRFSNGFCLSERPATPDADGYGDCKLPRRRSAVANGIAEAFG